MKKTTITIRTTEFVDKTLSQIEEKQTTAAQIAIELFCYIRRATISELKGKFTASEITALADGYNGTMPVWEYLSSTSMFAAHVEDCEQLEGTFTRNGANFNQVIAKVKKLTAAQVAVLQLELYTFWQNTPPLQLKYLIEKFE